MNCSADADCTPLQNYILLLQIAGTYFAYLMSNANPGTCSLDAS